MVTLNKLVSDIRNIATSGANTIDFRITDSQIRYWIQQTRAMLISQQLKKRNDISDSWLQSLNCIKLQEVDKSECCEITTDCYILRTILQIPETIDNIADNLIVRVEKPNGDIISKTNPFKTKYTKYSKFTKEKSRWYLKNGYIYISNEIFIDTINIWGLFEDPTELSNFTSCDGSTCYNTNSNYPVGANMASDITNIILKTKVLPYMQMPQDNTNDANNDLKANIK